MNNLFPLRGLLAVVVLLGTTTLSAQDFPYIMTQLSEPSVTLGEDPLDY